MTDKRFDLVCDNNLECLMQEELFLPIMDKYTNNKISLKQCYDLLNSLAQEEQVEKENKELKNDEKQLSIDFLDYKMKLRKVLRNHYLECQKWGDTHTQLIIKQIAGDLELTENKRFTLDDNGVLIDNVTKETYNNVSEVADTLNYYEENCLRYQKIISELKDGTYKEPLPITSRK